MPLYATAPRRINALVLDGVIQFVGIAVLVMFGSAADWPVAVDVVLLLSLFAIPILYEPLLVSRRGATLGHRWQNLHVVADGGGNPGFGRALLRFLVKLPFGIASFATMPATRRHQGAHDVVARTTVQIRDPERAAPGTFVEERPEPIGAMPSIGRRVIVTLAWWFLLVIGTGIATILLVQPYQSPECIEMGICSSSDRLIDEIMGFALLAGSLLLIGYGAAGRLRGARRKA